MLRRAAEAASSVHRRRRAAIRLPRSQAALPTTAANIPERSNDGGGSGRADRAAVTAPSPERRPVVRRPARRCRFKSAARLFAVAFLCGFALLVFWQWRAFFVTEREGPLDHVATSIIEPYYARRCPEFASSSKDRGDDASRDTRGGEEGRPTGPDPLSWNCDDHYSRANPGTASGTTGPPHENNATRFPRIYMMGARDRSDDTFRLWKEAINSTFVPASAGRREGTRPHPHGPELKRIRTVEMSNEYALSGGARTAAGEKLLCRSLKWEHRLFSVYQTIFRRILDDRPADLGFVVVEDDSLLLDPRAFVEEVCLAEIRRTQFYSLYRSPRQGAAAASGGPGGSSSRSAPSCVYRHGTVGFYIRRETMRRIVEEKRRGWFCRFPVDMYISRLGPWYASRRDVVGHSDGGRIGSD